MNASKYLLPMALCAAFFAGCASGPPPAKEFPAGARAPNATEIASTFPGKSFNFSGPGGIRTDYAKQGNAVTVYFSGRSDVGTWRAEDGRVCLEKFLTIPPACNDVRMVGSEAYLKRTNGDVVKLMPR
ncbi:MAG TPA: hypothetical protein PKZ76_18960 [Xanthomonadaceae bacterium]|nr:hypothetical protein [Xanthomonadaceae bacterium]